MERRQFLKVSALGAAATMIPAGLASAAPAARKKAAAASDKIRLGFIGLGQQGRYLWGSFIKMEDVRLVAGCDVYDIKRERFQREVTDFYKKKGEKKVVVDLYEDYQDLIARPDIDAVVIAVPDHQHALVALAALKAGKDVYLEKPMTLTIYEGQVLCKAVRKYNRILQVGSQQRSSAEFTHACNIVRNGDLGKIERVNVYVGRNLDPNSGHPVDCKLPKMEVPAGLNWDKWLGPLPESIYYHSDLDPIITPEDPKEKLWGAWRWYKVMGGGLMTDWGAHMFDIAQWGIGKDLSGPCKVIPGGYGYYDKLTYKYDNGIVMTEGPVSPGNTVPGVRFYGSEGWVEVHRGSFTCSDPKFEMKKGVADDDVPYEARAGHHRIFIDSVKSRIDPNVPVEIGHSSCTVCNLGNIAATLGRPVVWNPIVQKFMGDDEEATKLLHYEYRKGYKLEL